MDFLLFSKPQHPEMYRVHRIPNDPKAVIHRHSGLQRILDDAPPVDPNGPRHKFPHRYHDGEGLFGTNTSLYEYPAQRYPYHRQGKKWKATNEDGTPAEKGTNRTITDRNKNFRGVLNHPKGDRSGFVRADEIYPECSSGTRFVTRYQRQEEISGSGATSKVRNVGVWGPQYFGPLPVQEK